MLYKDESERMSDKADDGRANSEKVNSPSFVDAWFKCLCHSRQLASL